MREHLLNSTSKFEFTQGYSFRNSPKNLRPFLEAIKARSFNTWDQMAWSRQSRSYVWNDAQFELLERGIQVAAEVGLNVWPTSVPPGGSEDIARMPLAQRREYYCRTVGRFARLADKHPNLINLHHYIWPGGRSP